MSIVNGLIFIFIFILIGIAFSRLFRLLGVKISQLLSLIFEFFKDIKDIFK